MRTPEPEALAAALIQAVCAAFGQLKEEQNALFLELGYTASERIALSVTLAETLYRTGIVGYPKKQLHALISEGELQAIVYLLVCGDTPERVEGQYVKRLAQRVEIHYHYDRHQPREQRREEAPNPRSTGSDDVPSVLSRDRASRRGAHARRTGRDPGRTRRGRDDLPLY